MYKGLIISLIIIFLSATILIALPFKQKNILKWEAVTTNVDGSPAIDLDGYKVYWTQTKGVYTNTNSKEVGKVTSININDTIGNLKGLYCFVVTAYDISKNESDFSNEVCESFIIKKSSPKNLISAIFN